MFLLIFVFHFKSVICNSETQELEQLVLPLSTNSHNIVKQRWELDVGKISSWKTTFMEHI